MPHETSLSALHYHLIRGLLDRYACPSNAELASLVDTTKDEIERLLRSLAGIHGVVLHPHVCDPWVVHPFSITPTLNWVAGARGGWWAPCIWCAFGIAVLAGGETRIQSRFGAEGEAVSIRVIDGEPATEDNIQVHFAIPPAHAWDNVHEHCALVLPFRSSEEIRQWCARHRLPFGEAVPIGRVARLARLWYGSHGSPSWHKWTVEEAQEIFREAGLESDFWDLGAKSGRF